MLSQLNIIHLQPHHPVPCTRKADGLSGATVGSSSAGGTSANVSLVTEVAASTSAAASETSVGWP